MMGRAALALVTLIALALSGCDTDGSEPLWVDRTTQAPAPDNDATYRSCADVRAAGKAPLHRGDPGYASRLDPDGDGVACERG